LVRLGARARGLSCRGAISCLGACGLSIPSGAGPVSAHGCGQCARGRKRKGVEEAGVADVSRSSVRGGRLRSFCAHGSGHRTAGEHGWARLSGVSVRGNRTCGAACERTGLTRAPGRWHRPGFSRRTRAVFVRDARRTGHRSRKADFGGTSGHPWMIAEQFEVSRPRPVTPENRGPL